MPFITQGKTNLKYILIVGILALVVGAGILGYGRWIAKEEAKLSGLLGLEQNEEETEKPFQPLNTEGWQAYRNEEYGFEFKYPAEWYDKPGETKEEAGRFYLFGSSFCGRSCQRENSNISFGVENNDALLSVSEWMKQNVVVVGIEADEPIIIDGSQGIKRNYKGVNNSTVAVLVIFPQKDKLDTRAKQRGGDEAPASATTLYYFETSGHKNIEILNQILLDFRFLK